MNIKVGDYQIESDALQFVVKKKSIIQEGKFTKAENVGNEVYKPVAYAVKFEEAIRYVPQDALRNNEDINIIKDKLEQIQGDIQTIKEYPVIFIKEEPKVKIISDEDMEQLEKEEVE